MTLVLTVNGPRSIWALADRRLSAVGLVPRDDACKLLDIQTTDGHAILGYSGLGATAERSEPSQWMSNVLRGRRLTMEQSLSVLFEAMKRELLPHLITLNRAPAHHLLASAFVDGEHRLYGIDIVRSVERRSWFVRFTRHVNRKVGARLLPHRGSWAGTGGQFVERNPALVRDVLTLVNSFDRARLSADVVADQFARLNYRVHLACPRTVGPKCIVVWRNTYDGVVRGGGGHHFYTKEQREPNTPSIPTISLGLDVSAMVRAMMPFLREPPGSADGALAVEGFESPAFKSAFDALPSGPDESLP